MVTTAVGIGQGMEGREAGRQALQQALNGLPQNSRPGLVLAFMAQEYNPQETVNGIASLAGNIPVWGLSTNIPLATPGEQARSVVVAVLANHEGKVQVQWLPNYAQEPAAARQFLDFLQGDDTYGALLALDGINGDAMQVIRNLQEIPITAAGCLTVGGYEVGRTLVAGDNSVATGSLAVVRLGDQFCLGTGAGHGWQQTGLHYQVTRTHDAWLQALDNETPAEIYGRAFGRPAREWSYPPLRELVRLYPFGVELSSGSPEFRIHSPLLFGTDGALRMSMPIEQGQVVHLLVGDPQACLDAAWQAAQAALNNLHEAQPLLALLFVDISWHFLFATNFNQVIDTIRRVIGDIPLAGAFTLGQIVRQPLESPQLLNQHIQVVILGSL